MSEGTDASTDTGSDSGQGGDGGGQRSSNEQNNGGSSWTPPSSQEELNRVIADRLARQKAQFDKKYEGYDDLKSKAAEYDRVQEAAKSDLQKAQDREQAATERANAAVSRAVRAEVKALATGEFADPTDAHLYLGDLSKFVDGKSGDIDSAAIESALKDIGKAKPHLLRITRTDVGVGARGGKQPQSMNDLIRQAAGRG